MSSDLDKKVEKIVKEYIQLDNFFLYENWVAEYEALRNELVELFDSEIAQAVQAQRERTIHEICLEFNDIAQNADSFKTYGLKTLEWFTKHDKLLSQEEK